MEDLTDVLGDYAATVLWGAAFEDLLATDLPDGRNIADDYLRRRGWKEIVSTRDYIAGLRRSVISLHEVGGLVPGQSMRLRDLVRGGEPVRVSEKRGSEGLRRWDRIATRVVPLRGVAVISGTLMLFEHEAGEALLASLRKIRTKAPRDVAAAAREFGIEAGAEALAGMLTPDLLLAQAAFMFTNAWLDAALRAAQGRDRPELLNSEGDPLEFTVLHFPLLPGVTAERVRKALASLPARRTESPNFWNRLAEPGAKPKAVPRRAKGQTLPSARRGSRAACRRKTSARWSSRAWTTTTGASSTTRSRLSAASRREPRRGRRRGGRRWRPGPRYWRTTRPSTRPRTRSAGM